MILQFLSTMHAKLRLSQSKYVLVLEFYRIAITPTNLVDTLAPVYICGMVSDRKRPMRSSCILSYRRLPISGFSLFFYESHHIRALRILLPVSVVEKKFYNTGEWFFLFSPVFVYCWWKDFGIIFHHIRKLEKSFKRQIFFFQ